MPDEAGEVLLIEDNPDDAAFFKHAFDKVGVANRLRIVRDGAEALDHLFSTGNLAGRGPANRPSVVFLDLKMPKVNGLEVLRRLKSDPRTQSIPIVALSSSQEGRDLVEVYRLGGNSYIVKPMDFDKFAETVRMLVEYWLRFNQTPNP